MKFIHIEFSSLSIYLHIVHEFGVRNRRLAKFQFINREFNAENMPFNENNKYGEFSSIESFSTVLLCDKWKSSVFIR